MLTLKRVHSPLKERGTPSCRQAMYRQAAATASLLRPFTCFSSWTCLNNTLQRSYKEKQ